MTTGEMVRRYRPSCLARVDDYRLLFGTPEQIAKVRQQIKRRSKAAKAGWVKRRAASGTEAGTATTENTGVVHDGPTRQGDAQKAPQ